MSNQKCMIQPTLTNLHPDEYSQEFHYYPFSVKLDRWVGSCSTINDLSNKVYIPSKTEDLNLRSKRLKKHISCKSKCRFDERKCNADQ